MALHIFDLKKNNCFIIASFQAKMPPPFLNIFLKKKEIKSKLFYKIEP